MISIVGLWLWGMTSLNLDVPILRGIKFFVRIKLLILPKNEFIVQERNKSAWVTASAKLITDKKFLDSNSLIFWQSVVNFLLKFFDHYVTVTFWDCDVTLEKISIRIGLKNLECFTWSLKKLEIRDGGNRGDREDLIFRLSGRVVRGIGKTDQTQSVNRWTWVWIPAEEVFFRSTKKSLIDFDKGTEGRHFTVVRL